MGISDKLSISKDEALSSLCESSHKNVDPPDTPDYSGFFGWLRLYCYCRSAWTFSALQWR